MTSPDIREKAERLLLELQSYAMDGNAYEGDHLSSELALPLISQALLEAHNAGREEMEREMKPARVYFERYCQDEAEDVENCVCGEQQHEDAKAYATAIRSIK